MTSAATLLLVAGCGGAESAARSALDTAEQALAEAAPAAEPVVPELVANARAAVAAGREMLEQGDVESALESAQVASSAAAALPVRASEARTRLADEWDRMRPAMEANLDSVRIRLDRFGRARSLPVGVTPAGLESARETHAAAVVTWPDIVAEYDAGRLATAMDRAMNLRVKVSGAMEAVGLVADDRAWGNLQLRPADST
jgi:hypothetical protein